MHLFNRLVLLALAVMAGILVWDLAQRRPEYPGKKLIVYAGMFGPGEPMQQLYAGPPSATVPGQPFGPSDLAHYRALIAAFPQYRDRVIADYASIHGRALDGVRIADSGFRNDPKPLVTTMPNAESPIPNHEFDSVLADRFRELAPAYVERLVEALGRSDRHGRLNLFYAFAERHPRFDGQMISQFESLHPAWHIGLFEDFERRYPDYKIVQRWDGRWVLPANRPRFLTGSDVPDIIGGSLGELRILMRENLALPLDQPLPHAAKESWRKFGVLRGEPSFTQPDRPDKTFQDDIYDWAIAKSRYTVTAEDIRDSGNPYPPGQQVLYLIPQEVRTFVIFYNKAHLRLIGAEVPRTVNEFEAICRKLKQTENPAVVDPHTGKHPRIEPIANDGIDYTPMWWDWLIIRTIGNDNYVKTVMNDPVAGRFAGPRADPHYLAIARRLRKWRDDGFWMEGFSSSQWPAAQRDFSNGKCTFLLTGSWLPAEIDSTRSKDPNVFDLGCFFFPRADAAGGDSPDADSIQIAPQGHVICRQGGNPEGAVLLLRYLIAYGGQLQSQKISSISGGRNAPFPAAMSDIAPAMIRADASRFLGDGPGWYAPQFNKFVLNETYPKFFLVRDDGLSPEQFVEELERRAQKHYQLNGGQAR